MSSIPDTIVSGFVNLTLESLGVITCPETFVWLGIKTVLGFGM